MTLGPFGGVNAGYVLELYERYRQNPESVDPATRKAFESWTPTELDALAGPNGPALAAPADVTTPNDVRVVVGAANLAESIRRYGHLAARLDPLGSEPPGDPSLSTRAHGITDEDLKALPASLVGGPLAESSSNALDAIEKLRRVYCSTTGFDYSHVFVPEERDWLRHAAESGRFLPPMDPASAEELLDRITQVEVFERFLHRTFPGKTRFSIEGVDMLVPILDAIIAGAASQGARHTIVGMAHRGRLNVLAHILEKPYAQILAEFKDPVAQRTLRIDLGWMGDVKYHAGAITTGPASHTYVTMPPNPSHLEAVNPVVAGMARAAGTVTDQPGPPRFDGVLTLPILIHGDMAFPGQGIVAETLNLSRLSGYETAGTIHIIANNQLGIHGHAGRVLQHELRKRAGARVQDPDRPRQRRRSGRVPGGGAAGVGIPRALRSGLPDRSHWLPAVRPQRRRRAGVHAAAHVQGGCGAQDGTRAVCRTARRAGSGLERIGPGAGEEALHRARAGVRIAQARRGLRGIGLGTGARRHRRQDRDRRACRPPAGDQLGAAGRSRRLHVPQEARTRPRAASRAVEQPDGAHGRLGRGRGAGLRHHPRRRHPDQADRRGRRARHVQPSSRGVPRCRERQPVRAAAVVRAGAGVVRNSQQPAQRGRHRRLRVRLQHPGTVAPRDLGSAVRRLHQRRPGHPRPVRDLGAREVGTQAVARVPAAARLRGTGPGALERKTRADSAGGGGHQPSPRELHDGRAVLSPAAPAGGAAPPGSAPALRPHAEEPAAASSGRLRADRARAGPLPVGHRR